MIFDFIEWDEDNLDHATRSRARAFRNRADNAGVKVTSFIRASALEATSPVDLVKLTQLAQDLERRAHDVAVMASRGVA